MAMQHRKRNAPLWALALGLGFVQATAQPVATEHSKVELVAEQASLPADGGVVTLGLHLEPDPGWHAYWVNPGDAGLPATLRWTLPEGFAAAEAKFPTPHVIPFGDLVTYGFEEPILLLTDITVPSLASGGTARLAARARWVVCDDQLCVPEQANVAVTLPVGSGDPVPASRERFAAARSQLPRPVDWPARFQYAGEEMRVAVSPPDTLPGGVGGMRDARLFVARKHLVRYGRQEVSYAPRGVVFAMDAGPRPGQEAFNAVLAFADGGGEKHAVRLEVRAGDDLAALVAGTGAGAAQGGLAATGTAPPPGGLSFAYAFLFALLGGVVLNLMPCVFPILSMKALGLVNSAQGDQRAARQSGLLYTAGILAAFAAIGALWLGLRAAGDEVGWGFQLQSPAVNLALALLMVAIGLNLLGVFEIGTRVTGVGETLTGTGSGQGEKKAAFFTGLLAVVVATPCTAPFMAGALGYTLVLPPVVSLGVFLFLGVGLALPYLLLSYVPALGRMLPRPGPWMATFRSALAFPMFATAVWLLWVVGGQRGADGMAIGLLAAIALALALWAYGRVFGNARPWLWRGTAVVALAATAALGWQAQDHGAAGATGDHARLGQLELETFSPELVTGYIAAGQPFFLYFTADWCVSCKVNERVALKSDAVGEAFRARGIKVLEGDWTNEDHVITAWLRRYGRVGVPLYLYFPRGSSLDAATILPQILVPDIVIDAVAAADAESAAA